MSSMYEAARRMARRYGRIGLAEPDDIAHEAMLKLLAKKDGVVPTIGWLSKVVFCTAMDAGREASREKRRTWQERGGQVPAVCERAGQGGRVRVRSRRLAGQRPDLDLMPRLQAALDRLSEPLRKVLVLKVKGMSYKEIAELAGVSIGTVRSRLHYVRKRARMMLQEMP